MKRTLMREDLGDPAFSLSSNNDGINASFDIHAGKFGSAVAALSGCLPTLGQQLIWYPHATIAPTYSIQRLDTHVRTGNLTKPVEEFVHDDVLPCFFNSHTEASYCGTHISAWRAEARGVIAKAFGADAEYAVIFSGTGPTSRLNRIVHPFAIQSPTEQ